MSKLKNLLKWGLISTLTLVLLALGYGVYLIESFDTETLPENHGRVKTELFLGQQKGLLGQQKGQPLVVGLGGGEGGNGWAGPHGQKQRTLLAKNGYAFLSIAYFGIDGTPANLDRIAIEGVHGAVMETSEDSRINGDCIAVMGVSRGGELALLLGSLYSEYKSVIGIVPGSAVFASITYAMKTPAFSHHGESLPFVPVPWAAAPALLSGDLRGAFEKMMMNTEAMEAAAIRVENISGPLLLISGTEDEQWPSMEMSEAMMQRLEENEFPYSKHHMALEGGHNEHHDEFESVISFLDEHLLSQPGCERE